MNTFVKGSEIHVYYPQLRSAVFVVVRSFWRDQRITDQLPLVKHYIVVQDTAPATGR